MALSWGQFSLGANTYSDVLAQGDPEPRKRRIVHEAPDVTVFPTKDTGYQPAEFDVTLKVAEGSVDDFIADVLTGSAEREIHWMIGATEVYSYTYSGDVRSVKCLQPHGTVTTRYYAVHAVFPLSRSKVYKNSDDSVLWGA